MRRDSLGWSLLALAGAALAATFFLEADGGAAVVEAQDEASQVRRWLGRHDLGTLIGPMVLEHVFRVTNDGPEPWRVVETSQDCGCVNVVSAPAVVEPGTDLELRVRIETAGQPHGRLEKNVYAWVEPGALCLVGTVTADLIPPAHAEPGVVELEVPRGERIFRAEARIRVPAHGEPPTLALQDGADAVLVEIGAGVRAGDLVEFPVSITGELSEDRELLRETLRFTVSGAPGSAAAVPIALVVHRHRELYVSPQALYLAVEGAVPARGELFVKDPAGRPPRELDWSVEPADAFAVTWERERGVLRLEIADASRIGDSARLILRSESGGTVVVPVLRSTP